MSNDKIRQECARQYENASIFEQRLVQLCSVMYETRNRTTILKCYLRTGLPFPEGTFYKVQLLTPYMKKLQERNLLDDQFRCRTNILEFAVRRSIDDGNFDLMVKAVLQEMPSRKTYHGYNGAQSRDCIFLMRDFRIGVYSHNTKMVRHNHELIMTSKSCESIVPDDPFLQVCNEPFDGRWFRTLPVDIRVKALRVILPHTVNNLEPDQEALACALQHDLLKTIPNTGKDGFFSVLVTRLVLGGRLKEARKITGMLDSSGYTAGLTGWILFMEGKNNEAIASYETDLKLFRKMVYSRNEYFRGMAGIFFILAQLKTGDASLLPKISKLIEKATSNSYSFSFVLPIYHALETVYEIQKGNVDRAKRTVSASFKSDGSLADFFRIFASYWLNNKISAEEAQALRVISFRAEKAEWKWLSMECALLLSDSDKKNRTACKNLAKEIQNETGMVSILSMVPREELWKKSLRALIASEKPDSQKDLSRENSRLVWLFDTGFDQLYLQPLEQKRGKNGIWSRGRNVALKRLLQGTTLPYITEQDKRIAQTIRMNTSYDSGTNYYFDREKASVALIGHPLIFLRSSHSTPVTMEKGEPVVSVKQIGARFKIQFTPDVSGEKVLLVEQSPTRIEVIQINEGHRRIACILGKDGLSVPLQGKKEILAAIGAISSSVAVHSSIGGATEKVLETESDPVPRIRILPSGEGFHMEMLVRPFGEGGPYLKPGIGNETLIAGIHGKRMQTRRDLKREETMAAAVEAGCPSLSILTETSRDWHLNTPEDCLQVLTELKVLQDNKEVSMEWPKGGKLRVTREISFDRLRMNIRTGADWFEIGGGLELNKQLVMDMTKLLDLVKETEHRFIPLGDNLFAALTTEFRKKLSDMDAYSYRKGGAVRFHPFSALLLEELTANLPGINADKKWQAKTNSLKKIRDSVPSIPTTLKAELRDYQQTGYQWMTRLASWGVGACLADDMGLGKTVQALAVLLDRAADGPALIVAPTSVCHNWIGEANRFAPTLNTVPFGGKDREGVVHGLKGFDVLVSSYGLLQQETDLLASVRWHTIVLDEAQAIKNVTAKRSRAAMNLKGDFRIITTGTPIENHLGELWTLFNFINPGLLGSLEGFNTKFALPIEQNNDRMAKKRLRKLIHPFILRRIKTEVLEELPPRTDVMLHVEMDGEEAAFYEALRQNALQKLEQDKGHTGQKHLKILAEIMRLRRACCHPRLIMPESPLAGAKLEQFGEVVSELLENRHKALVFSQFVGHLDILREYLNKKKIDYRYLDGSTPAGERQKQVQRFQKGEGDLFLISLKAGGMGLNLTAASYVIHMDPWWNPAVEDQASDRAHRIGQQHPVTVYRLITRGTIEEKIIALHQKKRDLADSLLDGTDMSGKISAEDLLRLIRED